MDEARVRFPTSATVSFEARLAQSVEHKTLNLGVAGSTPALGFLSLSFGLTGAMVARLPTEQEVVGSSPTLGLL